MKLHTITLKNLNSLYGEHRIDLHQDLGRSPLFMILGPTGAGKSTILDAVCLALFGQTPRLVHRRGQAHTDARLIMSQGCGECLASVEFSKRVEGALRRYRATWRCHRSRHSPAGRLQPAERTLLDVTAEHQPEILIDAGTARAQVQEGFEAVLEGMTVDDFKRSMLLAQGQFAAFIQANQAERVAILERLTSTERYQQLSQRAKERSDEAAQRRRLLEQRAEAEALMSVQEFESLRRRHKDALAHQNDAQAALERALSEERWWTRRLALQNHDNELQLALRDAQQAIAARRADFERLDEDARCRNAEALLRDWRRLHAEVERLEHQASELTTARDGQAPQVQVAADEASAARAALDAQVEQARSTREAIAVARGLRQQLRRAEDELRLARMASRNAREERDNVQGQLLDVEARLQDAVQRRDKRQRQAEAVAHLEPLTRELSGLRERHHHLGRYAAQLESRLASRDEDLRALTTLQRDATMLKARLDEAVRELEPFVEARAEALGRLRDAVAGAGDVEAARASLDKALRALARRRQQLLSLERGAERAEQLAQSAAQDAQRRSQVTADLARVDAGIAALQIQEQEAQLALEAVNQHLMDIRLARSLVEHRARLAPQRPCPLCGSLEHPYHDDADSDAEPEARLEARETSLQHDLVAQRRRLSQIAEQTREHAAARARLDAALESLDGEDARRAQEAEALQDERMALLRAVGLEAAAGREEVDAALAAAERQQENLEATLRNLAAGHSLLQTCEQTVEKGQRAVSGLEQSLASLQARLQDHAHTVSRHDEAITSLQRDLDEATREMISSLNAHGIEVQVTSARPDAQGPAGELPEAHVEPVDDADRGQPAACLDLQSAVEEATRLMGIFLDRRNALGTAQALCDRLQKSRDEATRRMDEATRRHQERRQAEEERERAAESLRGEVAAHRFGSRPARFELELEETLQAARNHDEAKRAEAEALARRFEQTVALAAEVTARLTTTRAQRATQRARLTEELGELAIEDIEAFSVALLSPMERQKLDADRRRLIEARQSAQAALKWSRQELDSHDEQRPEGMDLLALSSERLAEQRASLERALEEATEQALAARRGIDEQLRRAEGHEALQAELLAVTREAERWEELCALILGKDGRALRRFAQLLNLQALLEQANRHLTRLAPRYTLTTADAGALSALDFAVLDAHHTGRRRPLTTLSGGETFLVSLSLALALSDHHATRLPIETLLLDEGVGTLDQQSLDTVMAALERLQSGGTQIGIISHIDSLKARIPARILVEPVGGGRSVLRFEAPGQLT